MSGEVRVPRLAESISEAVLVEWLKADGAQVAVDEPIATLETDKAAVEIAAESAGTLRHASRPGDRVQVGQLIARIEAATGEPAAAAGAPRPPTLRASSAVTTGNGGARQARAGGDGAEAPAQSPAVRRLIEEHHLDPALIPPSGRGGRLLKEDVLRHLEHPAPSGPPRAVTMPAPTIAPAAPEPAPPAATVPASYPAETAPVSASAAADAGPASAAPSRVAWREDEGEERAVPMSRIRQRIAERLVRAQHTAAILTTFNEVDMSAVLELRARFRETFEKRHGVRLGLMSFFVRASILALEEIPELNAEIRGADTVYRRHVHLGIAVGTDRGLVVPVIRRADTLGFAGIESEIARLADRAREARLTLDELSGGTFTISNGGVYGSLLSTPILNPPQSGILGMHKIQKRPIAVDDQVVIRPMMYVALSYDHRIVDGEQAVAFLLRVKERLEDPERMLLDV